MVGAGLTSAAVQFAGASARSTHGAAPASEAAKTRNSTALQALMAAPWAEAEAQAAAAAAAAGEAEARSTPGRKSRPIRSAPALDRFRCAASAAPARGPPAAAGSDF